MKSRMDQTEPKIMPAPPNMIASLRAGFDAIANQIVIIIIPIIIDLFLWLGPHLQLKTLVNQLINSMTSSTDLSSIQSGDVISSSMDILRITAVQFNLLSLLRTIPVGIPSLMSSRLPIEIPNGVPIFFDISNPFGVAGIAIGSILVGLIIGCFYYILIGQVALNGKIDLRTMLKNWSWSSIQVISMALALLLLFIVISIPSMCAISALSLFGLPLSQFAIFIYIGVILWIAFPLLFAAHGIFVYHINAFASVQRSVLLTRMTLPTTSLFILSILVISQGFDFLWRIPPETSWLTLVGVGGHAFISCALLAASFVYYRDADLWTQETIKMLKSQRVVASKGN
jgi:hypothetical protein